MKPVDIEFTSKVNAEHVPVLAAIQGERERQDKKWGPQNHEYPMWLPILAEEMGEAAKEFLKATFPAVEAEGARREGNPVDTITVEERRKRFRKELIEAAAVLVAMIECGDRNQWFQKERRTPFDRRQLQARRIRQIEMMPFTALKRWGHDDRRERGERRKS